ncbi:hypothetical protein SIO70_12330 [Chitinophaga sancti]|uniref:hypothetical protein n=1 Tax=Chitinophaga sancti TaxID=1004 RepID=UPI002A7533CC|nr:hypothetical protein [Chitinophaga sancti]WPQ65637.1 hypothetical protein SIO70_12330 [Chitinophaga sancti]
MKKIYIRYIFILIVPVLMAVDAAPADLRYLASSKSVAQAGIVINGNHLYIADNDAVVNYDLSQPAAPVETARENLSMTVDTMYLYNDNLVICRDNYYGTVVYDVSSGGFNASGFYWQWSACNKVTLYDDKAFVVDKPGYSCTGDNPDDHVRMYTLTGNTTTSTPTALAAQNVSAFAVTENTVYASMESQGLGVIDLATNLVKTTFPDKVYYFLQVAGTKLYGRSKSSLDCYDISNPQNPKLISQLSN